ncbi:hypothetical protein AJ88_28355 [Mesorhizobium amorphae CCBAU 01583]|nr:hypothetical protein AJ88_28355 [Mesorhizobium amorphae CCBAU 01583]
MGLLISFEVAGRKLSFTKAARELGVTQAAVSRQIKMLEDFLGLQLFVRAYRSVVLTEDGDRLLQAVVTGLEHLDSTIKELQSQNAPRPLVIGTTSAFSTYWLMPRIARFRKEHSDIELRLAVDDRNVDLKASGLDLSIRYGQGNWANLVSHRLFGSTFEPICSPQYWGGRPTITDPADLLRESLLDHDIPVDVSWRTWFKVHGLEMPRNCRPFTMDLYPNLVEAVLSGQGIALLGRPLIDEMRESGAMINPTIFDAKMLPGGYHLVHPVKHHATRSQTLFESWLKSEAANDAVCCNCRNAPMVLFDAIVIRHV